MKLDATIRLRDNAKTKPLIGLCDEGNLSVLYDLDYCEDYDDVIKSVEYDLYEKYGVSLYHNLDFDIVNEAEICDGFSENPT